MNVGIVTVYKSHNCGSFLQTFALLSVLNRMGHKAYCIPYHMFANSLLDVLYQCFKCLLKCRFSIAIFLVRRYLSFNKAVRGYLRECSCLKTMDLFVFGSDTLWNFDDTFFYKRKKFFLGCWTSKRKISFSVSVGSSEFHKYLSDKDVIDGLRDFYRISVRDRFSSDFVKQLLRIDNVSETLDPTMLLKPEDYNFERPIKLKNDFIFIYYFGLITLELKKNLQSFAKQRGLKIINMGFPVDFADENVANDPFLFVQYIKHSCCVLTNTFHGCVFSILFNKKFATDGEAKKKIATLLEKFKLEERFFNNDRDFQTVIDKSIDFTFINSLVDKYRKESLDYLMTSIK